MVSTSCGVVELWMQLHELDSRVGFISTKRNFRSSRNHPCHYKPWPSPRPQGTIPHPCSCLHLQTKLVGCNFKGLFIFLTQLRHKWHVKKCKKPKTWSEVVRSPPPLPPCLGLGVSSLHRRDSHPGPSWHCAWHLLQPEHRMGNPFVGWRIAQIPMLFVHTMAGSRAISSTKHLDIHSCTSKRSSANFAMVRQPQRKVIGKIPEKWRLIAVTICENPSKKAWGARLFVKIQGEMSGMDRNGCHPPL